MKQRTQIRLCNAWAIVSWAVSIGCLVDAAWINIDTRRSFPNDGFSQLSPGLVMFPALMVIFAAYFAISGFFIRKL